MRKNVKSLNMAIENIGRMIKSSKKQYTWDLRIDNSDYHIIYVRSNMSGKDKIFVNGALVYKNQSLMREHMNVTFVVEDNTFVLVQYDQTYKLFINSKDFDDYFGHDRVKSILKKSRFEDEQEQSRLRLSGVQGNLNPLSVPTQQTRKSVKSIVANGAGRERSKSKKKVQFNLENNESQTNESEESNRQMKVTVMPLKSSDVNNSYIRDKTGMQGEVPLLNPQIIASPITGVKNKTFDTFKVAPMQPGKTDSSAARIKAEEGYSPYESSLLAESMVTGSSANHNGNVFASYIDDQPNKPFSPQQNVQGQFRQVHAGKATGYEPAYNDNSQNPRRSMGNQIPSQEQPSSRTAIGNNPLNQSMDPHSFGRNSGLNQSLTSFKASAQPQQNNRPTTNNLTAFLHNQVGPSAHPSTLQSNIRGSNSANQWPSSPQNQEAQHSPQNTSPSQMNGNVTNIQHQHQQPGQQFSMNNALQNRNAFYQNNNTLQSPQGYQQSNTFQQQQHTNSNSYNKQVENNSVPFDTRQMQAIGLPHPATFAKTLEPNFSVTHNNSQATRQPGYRQSLNIAEQTHPQTNYRGSLPLNLIQNQQEQQPYYPPKTMSDLGYQNPYKTNPAQHSQDPPQPSFSNQGPTQVQTANRTESPLGESFTYAQRGTRRSLHQSPWG